MDIEHKTAEDQNPEISSEDSKKPLKIEEKSVNLCVEQLQIGLTKFKLGITKKTLQPILKNKNLTAFKKKKWVNTNSTARSSPVRKLLQTIDEWLICELEYRDTITCKMLHYLEHIHFQNLVRLTLPSNTINNIESLSFLSAEKLQFLDLGGNYICQSKSLSKLNFKNLHYFEICNNPLFELNIGKFKCQKTKLYLRLIAFPSESVFQNISFLAKLQKNIMSSIMEFDLKYLSGQSSYGSSFNQERSKRKIIVQKKMCRTLKHKLIFAKN